MANTTKKNESDKSDKKSTKTAAKAASKQASAASDKPKASKAAGAKAPVKRRPLAEKTYFAKPGEVPAKWKLVDATGIPLGRLSSQIAMILMGKNKPTYTRFEDTGDFVLVINAAKVHLSGKKWDQKVYQHHTNYPGGLKTQTAKDLRETNPAYIVEKAVQRMLPTGHMGRKWLKKLRVFGGAEHPHAAQQPEAVKFQYATPNKES